MAMDAILLAGDFWTGGIEASYQRGFEKLGVRTHAFDVREFGARLGWVAHNRLAHRLSVGSFWLRERIAREFNRCLEGAAVDSGVKALLVVQGDWVMPETLSRLRRRGVTVAIFHPDNPFPPHVCQRPETLPAARETDLYLIWSERLVEKLKRDGVRNPVFLPFAWDPEIFPYQGDIPQGSWPGAVFLGNWSWEREAFLEEFASQVPLRIYGGGYWGTRTRARSRARSCWQGRDLRQADAARAIRESAVSLNVLRSQHVIDGVADGLIMRHFEVPGAGGFLLSTRGGGATRLFAEGETAEYFGDMRECVEKTRKYIADAGARQRIAARSHDLVAAHHQYTDRARDVLGLLEQCR
jgi:hypothetical protein